MEGHINWLFVAFSLFVVVILLGWLFTGNDIDDEVDESDADDTWCDILRENKSVLTLVSLLLIAAFIFAIDYRYLPIGLKSLLGACTASIVADVLYIIRWPLIVIVGYVSLWAVWEIYYKREYDASKDPPLWASTIFWVMWPQLFLISFLTKSALTIFKSKSDPNEYTLFKSFDIFISWILGLIAYPMVIVLLIVGTLHQMHTSPINGAPTCTYQIWQND